MSTLTPQKGERWLAAGMWEHESVSEVTVISTPDPQDSCVDIRYGDGSERLLPRECFLARLSRPWPVLVFNQPSAAWWCSECGHLVVRARDLRDEEHLCACWRAHNAECPLLR